ncbi:hypothetical protein QYF36_004738 [Acer negundo]|nr:hypothetical protein QYF36_004738 [Acer negundo]
MIAKLRVLIPHGVKSFEKTLAYQFEERPEGIGYPKFMPLTDLYEASNEYLKDGTLTVQVNDVMNIEVPREAGPWGGINGKQFDDGVFSSIGQVNIFVGDGIVRGIGFLYNTNDGKSVESKRHGGCGRDDEKLYRIMLDCSKEYIVGIMGYFGPVVENAGHETLRSITFYSNKGKYGPFGNEIGTAFSSPISDGKVVGFHGRSGCYLCALGVHMEYFDSN